MKVSKGFIASLVILLAGVVALLFLPLIKTSVPANPEYEARCNTRYLLSAIEAYMNEFYLAPTGTAAEIVSQLMSNNVRRIIFLEVSSRNLNASGEFCDPWDTPYRITISETNLSVRSAGPDTKFGTKDDIAVP